jgi:hypothetical protein
VKRKDKYVNPVEFQAMGGSGVDGEIRLYYYNYETSEDITEDFVLKDSITVDDVIAMSYKFWDETNGEEDAHFDKYIKEELCLPKGK